MKKDLSVLPLLSASFCGENTKRLDIIVPENAIQMLRLSSYFHPDSSATITWFQLSFISRYILAVTTICMWRNCLVPHDNIWPVYIFSGSSVICRRYWNILPPTTAMNTIRGLWLWWKMVGSGGSFLHPPQRSPPKKISGGRESYESVIGSRWALPASRSIFP